MPTPNLPSFDALRTMRAIRDDEALSATDKALLWAAVLRADSDSIRGREAGRVRASLELLATDAGLSSKSAGRVFKGPGVLAYFAKVERSTRRVGLWFHLTPETESPVTPDTESPVTPDTESAVIPDTESAVTPTPDSLSTTPDTESDHLPTHLQASKAPAITTHTASRPANDKSSSKSSNDSGTLADELAAATRWPLDHCHNELARKRTELVDRGIRHPDALLAKIVRGNPHELTAPVATQRTAAQCDSSDVHDRHEWTDARNRFWCQGVQEWTGDPYAPVARATAGG